MNITLTLGERSRLERIAEGERVAASRVLGAYISADPRGDDEQYRRRAVVQPPPPVVPPPKVDIDIAAIVGAAVEGALRAMPNGRPPA